ncbi:hypothetical protein, partial [Methylibium sp.]|uniref:hypothetical protein n=1 Tax=Methylibium sp. TaxID=2067992 RepID=UPI00286A94DA
GAAKARPGRRQRFIEAVSAALRLPCGARARGPSRNSLRSLRSLRSNKRDESEDEALRAATSPVLLSASKARCRLPGRAFADTAVGCVANRRAPPAASHEPPEPPQRPITTRDRERVTCTPLVLIN